MEESTNKSLPLHNKVLYSYYNKHIVQDREQKTVLLRKEKELQENSDGVKK